MLTINLSDECDAKLKVLARKVLVIDDPFITREFVIERAIDTLLSQASSRLDGDSPNEPAANVLVQDPDQHDRLDHTRIVSASIDGNEIHRAKWNTLYNELHLLAWKRLGSLDAVKQISDANLRTGAYENDGYRPLAGTDFSIQGVSSNLAWDHALTIARELKVRIRVVFEWREKPGAAHPGKRGLLEWKPAEA